MDFVGTLSLSLKENNDILSNDDILQMQDDYLIVSGLKKCVLERKSVNEWSESLTEFQRFAERFIVCKGMLYFARTLKGEDVLVPVMSLEGLIGLVKIVHNESGHMGRMKLWETMKGRNERRRCYL